MHLTENEIKELPECGVFWHPFVAVDEVMTTTESDLEHLVVCDAGMGIGYNIFGAERLFRHRPVSNGVALDFKALLFFLDKEKLQAVGPQTVLNSIDLTHDGFNFSKIFGSLLKVPDTNGILANIRLRATDDSPA